MLLPGTNDFFRKRVGVNPYLNIVCDVEECWFNRYTTCLYLVAHAIRTVVAHTR